MVQELTNNKLITELLKLTEMSKHKKWNALECSYLYHLITWGYSSKEVVEIATKFLPGRTADSIHAQGSDIRKYIGKQKMYMVSNYTITPEYEAMYKKAGKISPAESLEKYKQDKPFRPSHLKKETTIRTVIHNNSPVQIVETITQAPTEHKVEIELPKPQPKPQQNFDLAEPNVLDVMRLAKELGAAEVEYKGVKIKY